MNQQDNDPDNIIDDLTDQENNNDNNYGDNNQENSNDYNNNYYNNNHGDYDEVPNDFKRDESLIRRITKILSISESSDNTTTDNTTDNTTTDNSDSDDTSTAEIISEPKIRPGSKGTNLHVEFDDGELFLYSQQL